MSTKPAAYTWFLPTAGLDESCPDSRWRVTYRRGAMMFPVEVCAPDEDTAVYYAGMKRAGLLRTEEWAFPMLHMNKWERENVERLS